MQLTFKTKKELIQQLTNLDSKNLYLSQCGNFLRVDRSYTNEGGFTDWNCYRFDSGEIDSPTYKITRYGDGFALKRTRYYIGGHDKTIRVYYLHEII